MKSDTKNEGEKNKKHNKIIVGTMVTVCFLLGVYFGIAAYFRSHFYFGSEVNCISVFGKSVDEVNVQMKSQIKKYKLNLKEREGKSEQITADDINLKYNSGDRLKKLKENQGGYKWISAFFNRKDSKITVGLSYDDKLLRKKVNNLSCFNSKSIIEPKNCSFKYLNKNYVIIDEVNGNKVNKDTLYNNIAKAILYGETSVDLEITNCYVKPQYTSKSKKAIEIRDILNKYVSSKVIYTFGNNERTIDGSIINKWLAVNDNFEITFDENRIKKDMNVFFNDYNTVGKKRNFTTSSGKTINISGGDYGWNIDIDKEIQDLIADVKEGRTAKKKPEYIQIAASHDNNDIGDTYVEIDMTKQHLWFYKNGSLIVQGDVVTGNIKTNHSTPKGIYRLKYKQRNATLKGEGYSSHVDFWMPFNGGIGIHDASWRSQFGGDIYKTDGSHGCINSPYYLANTIYDNIESGTPVVCYY